MQSLLKSDIFFIITTVCVVVLSIFLVWVCISVLSILRDVKHLSKKVDEEGQKIVEDVSVIREIVKEKMDHLPFGLGSFFRKEKSRRTKDIDGKSEK